MSKVLGTWVEVEIFEKDEESGFCNGIGCVKQLVEDEYEAEKFIEKTKKELPRGQKISKYSYHILIKCSCGEEVICKSFKNECDGCGELYNKYGQHLKPREEWEDDERGLLR